ncbi:glutathione S-transferase [Litoreibacter ponti]|uniref:Glutathione S-transferase n=1 Tax=Litoreibacter ponti TaxID=1510457 RepID=A0A2T6BJJ6_9RHOB|nr:glutathione S-transferase family protein [Litoreibacter ponti]PTX56241.1 glutathione S-transferase [Litoreibacter ponti]
MYTVYSVDHSLYCAKLRLVLRHKRLEWRDVPPPGGTGSADYLSLVPTGNLPALVDGTLTLTDSEAIAEYLEEKHPSPAMLPSGLVPRALSRERSRFHDTRLEPALRLTFSNTDPRTRRPDEITAAHAEITKRLAALEILLKAPLSRDQLWLGDCGIIITCEWLDIMVEYGVLPTLDMGPEIIRYRAQMQEFDAVAAELVCYLPHMHDWMDSKHR